jgi:hypothetical protein
MVNYPLMSRCQQVADREFILAELYAEALLAGAKSH